MIDRAAVTYSNESDTEGLRSNSKMKDEERKAKAACLNGVYFLRPW